jgi:hypothetical protein
VGTDGVITTIAGTGVDGFAGDGGPAAAARLSFPMGVCAGPGGAVLVAEHGNDRVREVAADGTIATVAGTGVPDFSGDGGPATSAAVATPVAVAFDASGNLLIADTGNHRVRRVATGAAAPSIEAPADLVLECDEGQAFATVQFVFGVTAGPADLLRVLDVTGGRTLLETADPADGEHGVGPVAFAFGPASTVRIELLDGAAVVASASFTVQVEDAEAPALSGIGPKTLECQAPATPLAAAGLGISASDACDPAPTLDLSPASAGLGTTAVMAVARDATGNTATATFDVTVVDTRPPTFLICPSDVERDATGPDGAAVAFDVLATDESGEMTLECRDPTGRVVVSGSLFGVGGHTVVCTATDSSGNESTCTFHVDVVDRVAPMILCPGDLTVANDPGRCGATVEFEVVASDDADGAVEVVCEAPWGIVASGDEFPHGATPVVCRATDDAGNEATCGFLVVVQDREAPRITVPASLSLTADGEGRPLPVDLDVLGGRVADNCDGGPVVTCSPATVGPGTTTVTCTATDADGNVAQASVVVTVLKAALDTRILRPLRDGVDNRVRHGRIVPLRLRVTSENKVVRDATAVVESVVRIDGAGSPVSNDGDEDDTDLVPDEGAAMTLRGNAYVHHLRTCDLDGTPGARYLVTMRVSKAGHADAVHRVVLRMR